MSEDKICCMCHRGTLARIYSNGWYCESCVEDLQSKFYQLFSIDLCRITGQSGLLIELCDLQELLKMNGGSSDEQEA